MVMNYKKKVSNLSSLTGTSYDVGDMKETANEAVMAVWWTTPVLLMLLVLSLFLERYYDTQPLFSPFVIVGLVSNLIIMYVVIRRKKQVKQLESEGKKSLREEQ